MIVITAIKSSLNSRTVLFGDDADMLVLLLYYSRKIKNPLASHTQMKSRFDKLHALFNQREGTKPTKNPTPFGMYAAKNPYKFPQRCKLTDLLITKGIME